LPVRVKNKSVLASLYKQLGFVQFLGGSHDARINTIVIIESSFFI
jgi:hypothetical protein